MACNVLPAGRISKSSVHEVSYIKKLIKSASSFWFVNSPWEVLFPCTQGEPTDPNLQASSEFIWYQGNPNISDEILRWRLRPIVGSSLESRSTIRSPYLLVTAEVLDGPGVHCYEYWTCTQYKEALIVVFWFGSIHIQGRPWDYAFTSNSHVTTPGPSYTWFD